MIDDAPGPDVADERLRLMLLCCHPALDTDAQVALTLRLVSGLSTEEIAAAFLVPTPTMAQRVVRAKRKIRTAGIPLSMPERHDERLGMVLATLYLVFNEGYLSRSAVADPVRTDLLEESLRLTRLVVELSDGHPEALGLLALELFTRARVDTRIDQRDELVLLEDQDRSKWRLPDIAEGNDVLGVALRKVQPGPYQLQAIIASHHANAREAADTDWTAIVGLYAQLEAMSGSPVVRLNHAVAVAMADGPLQGLRMIDELDELDDYHLLWSTRAELSLRADRVADAVAGFERAISLVVSAAERAHLERRLAVASAAASPRDV